jgi:hypothetical protein
MAYIKAPQAKIRSFLAIETGSPSQTANAVQFLAASYASSAALTKGLYLSG